MKAANSARRLCTKGMSETKRIVQSAEYDLAFMDMDDQL
nr:MAG TPA: hypothetical protein [Bacteriophage sp.]